MPEQIKDGQGKGYLLGITSENRMKGDVVIQTLEYHSNVHEATAYHLVFSATPTATGDCFLYMKNTDDDDLIVESIWFRVASAESVSVKLGDTGTPVSGSAVTPTNCNAGSANSATGTFQTGSDITGLSSGSVVEKYWLTSTTSVLFNFEQDIILQKNSVLTLYATTGAVALAGTVVFHYHERE